MPHMRLVAHAGDNEINERIEIESRSKTLA